MQLRAGAVGEGRTHRRDQGPAARFRVREELVRTAPCVISDLSGSGTVWTSCRRPVDPRRPFAPALIGVLALTLKISGSAQAKGFARAGSASTRGHDAVHRERDNDSVVSYDLEQGFLT
jgi:hypothetical protein